MRAHLIAGLVLLPLVALGGEQAPSAKLFNDAAQLSIAFIPVDATLSEKVVRNGLDAIAKKKGGGLEIATMSRAEYPGLADEALKYTLGELTEADRAAVQRATLVVGVIFTWPHDEAGRLRAIYEAVAAVAATHKAVIFDRNAASAYTAAQWRARKLDEGWAGAIPVGPKHFQVHMILQPSGLIMMDTGGLPRFGIADFELLEVNRSSINSAGDLVNAVAQRLIEGARPDAQGRLAIQVDQLREPGMRAAMTKSAYPNAKRRLVVGFAPADVSLGARDDALELTFPELSCADRGQCLDAALKQLFGVKDETQAIQHDAAVNAAKVRALAALRRYEAKVKKGLPHGELLLVKARFPYEGGDEWMWVDVQSWSGKTLRGRLENEPESVKALKAGATVEVKLEDLMDYMYKLGDGTFYGNEVGKVVRPDLFEDVGGGRTRIRR